MTHERNRLYEGMYILNSNLSEDARKKALEKITKVIEDNKGEIHKVHDMQKRKLAYEINKRREGYYYLIYFSIDTSAIKELWNEYLLHEDIIRFMTAKADKVLETLEFEPLAIQQ
ncbi:MAG: 30S ribosomal protein S6 [Candidatus Anoxychlamydiales bacterium]|nr:30S ribosomal protein S6 [Candidatus Anoxychlamydiales bacterium]